MQHKCTVKEMKYCRSTVGMFWYQGYHIWTSLTVCTVDLNRVPPTKLHGIWGISGISVGNTCNIRNVITCKEPLQKLHK